MDLEADEEADGEGLGSDLTGMVTPDQVEAAVERVLMKILPERIEGILIEAIEKTVAKEISKIKSALLDDWPDIQSGCAPELANIKELDVIKLGD